MIKKLLTLTALVSLTIATANAGWLYLIPNFDVYGYRDRSGVLHCFEADAARYDQRTRVYEVRIGGRWLVVGADIYQLTDY
jgi:hypothetical protein